MGKMSRTYKLSSETIRRLEAQAQRLDVFPGPLVGLLLERALGEIESGRWPIATRPVTFRPVWKQGEKDHGEY